MSATPTDADASIGWNSMRVPIWPILIISLGLLASVAWTGFLAWGVAWVTVRVMSPNAGADLFNQYWPYDFFSQSWPYVALAASVVVLVLLWKTWKRVRRIEGRVDRLRADLVQIQHIESRRLFQEMKSASVAVTSIIPTANPGQHLDVQIDDGTRSAVISPATPLAASAARYQLSRTA